MRRVGFRRYALVQFSRSGVAAGVLAMLAAGVSGCGAGNGGGFRTATTGGNSLLGSWTRSALSVSGQTVTCPNQLTVNNIVVDSCAAGETITFNADSTYNITYPAARFGRLFAEYGTYSASGGTLTITRRTMATDTNGAGVLNPSTQSVPINPVQVIPNAFSVTLDGNSFTLAPQAPGTNTSYAVPMAPDGSTVTSTFTRAKTS